MSEFLLILVWLAIGTIVYGTMHTKEYVIVQGKKELRETWFWAMFLFAPVIYMAGARSENIGDSLLSSKLQKNMSEKWLLFKKATFSDCIEGSFL